MPKISLLHPTNKYKRAVEIILCKLKFVLGWLGIFNYILPQCCTKCNSNLQLGSYLSGPISDGTATSWEFYCWLDQRTIYYFALFVLLIILEAVLYVLPISDRMCSPPPPPPVLDGENGTSTWSGVPAHFNASYGFNVTYTCGKGRKFTNVLGNMPTYLEETKSCMWNGSWYPTSVSAAAAVYC